MISPEDVAQLALEVGVGEAVAERIGDYSRPAVALIANGPPRSDRASRCGGRPLLPPGEPWPTTADSEYPLVFLAQLHLAELPLEAGLPPGGLLSLFVGWDPASGHLDGRAIVHHFAEDAELVLADPPDALLEQEDDLGGPGVLPALAVEPLLVATIPPPEALARLEPDFPLIEPEDAPPHPQGYGPDEFDALFSAVTTGQHLGGHVLQLMGWPDRLCNPPADLLATIGAEAATRSQAPGPDWAAAPWALLAEIPAGDAIPSFGDGGTGWLCVPEDELQAGRFSAVWSACESS